LGAGDGYRVLIFIEHRRRAARILELLGAEVLTPKAGNRERRSSGTVRGRYTCPPLRPMNASASPRRRDSGSEGGSAHFVAGVRREPDGVGRRPADAVLASPSSPPSRA
jgi:hypothetical protein